jgi:hypothetical protein
LHLVQNSAYDAVMVTRDLIDNITAILFWPDLEGQPEDVHGDIWDRAETDRRELADDLRLAWENGDEDPLLASLAIARGKMLAAEHDMRLLLAYGREFTEPRPYRLEDLARAAGLSMSGVRIAYDDDEVARVAEITGLRPRQRSQP